MYNKSIPIQIGRWSFDSIKAATETVSKLLRSSPINVRFSPEWQEFLIAMLERHPEAESKIGVGVDHFTILSNGYGDKDYCKVFCIVRTDGSTETFSYKNCLKPKSCVELAYMALRREVSDQVIAVKTRAFSQADTIVCPIVKKLEGRDVPITFTTSHVDHNPEFKDIVDSFLCSECIELDDIRTEQSATELAKVMVDRELAARWKSYHLDKFRGCVVSTEGHMLAAARRK